MSCPVHGGPPEIMCIKHSGQFLELESMRATTGDVTSVVITIVVTTTAQPQVQVLEDRTESMGAFHMTLEEAACLLECIFSGINSSTDHMAV